MIWLGALALLFAAAVSGIGWLAWKREHAARADLEKMLHLEHESSLRIHEGYRIREVEAAHRLGILEGKAEMAASLAQISKDIREIRSEQTAVPQNVVASIGGMLRNDDDG